jgi:hypothetical protein
MLKDQNESSMGTKGTLGNCQATWGHSPPEKEYNMIQPTKKGVAKEMGTVYPAMPQRY